MVLLRRQRNGPASQALRHDALVVAVSLEQLHHRRVQLAERLAHALVACLTAEWQIVDHERRHVIGKVRRQLDIGRLGGARVHGAREQPQNVLERLRRRHRVQQLGHHLNALLAVGGALGLCHQRVLERLDVGHKLFAQEPQHERRLRAADHVAQRRRRSLNERKRLVAVLLATRRRVRSQHQARAAAAFVHRQSSNLRVGQAHGHVGTEAQRAHRVLG